MKFIVRVLRETSGLTDARLRHTYEGDGTPFDTGLIDWKRVREEDAIRKTKKKTRAKKTDGSSTTQKRTRRKRTDVGSEPDSVQMQQV